MCHTDAAAVSFFASAFLFAHECYEAFMEEHLSLGEMLEEGKYLVPIVHAEADYQVSLKLSQKIAVQMSLGEVKRTSFVFNYSIFDPDGNEAIVIKHIHAVIDARKRKPMRIPAELKEILELL
jgi:YbgC/YbaW family acyl-CoA thioester hydrolase